MRRTRSHFIMPSISLSFFLCILRNSQTLSLIVDSSCILPSVKLQNSFPGQGGRRGLMTCMIIALAAWWQGVGQWFPCDFRCRRSVSRGENFDVEVNLLRELRALVWAIWRCRWQGCSTSTSGIIWVFALFQQLLSLVVVFHLPSPPFLSFVQCLHRMIWLSFFD